MRTTLVCPIRTLINLNTATAYANAEHFNGLLKLACERAGERTGDRFWTDKRPPVETAFTKYVSRGDDKTTWAATPLAECEICREDIGRIEERAGTNLKIELAGFEQVNRINLRLFDNTMSVALIEIETDMAAAQTHFADADAFEQHFTAFAASVADYLQTRHIRHFTDALSELAHKKRHWPVRTVLLRHPGKYMAFDDLAEHPWPHWREDRASLVWAHRVFHIHDLPEGTDPGGIAILRNPGFPAQTRYITQWGNSYLYDPAMMPKFLEMQVVNQYFFALLDFLGHSQKRLIRRLVGTDTTVRLPFAQKKFDRLESMIAETHHELLDYASGLQDLNGAVFNHIRDAFGTGELLRILETRSTMIKERIERVLTGKRMIQSRMIAFVLAVVGGVQVLSLMLDAAAYADRDANDDVVGLLDLAAAVPPDYALNVTFIVLVTAALIWSLVVDRR